MSFDKIKKLEGKRKYLFYGCLTVMLIMLVLLFTITDTLFTQIITITYPDKCVEIYKNNNLTTPECTNGRLLKAQQENQTFEKRVIQQMNFPITFQNITIK